MRSKDMPTISVIMPAYNTEKYIGTAIESILQQTFEDFEFIIIDDASTDHTYDIICHYHDKRIIRIRNEKNLGVAACINKGILIAHSEFIARMDSDDISKPERFQKQMEFMNANSNLGISGTHMETIDKNGKVIKEHRKKIGNEAIKVNLFFGHTSLAHPSIIMRRKIMDMYHLRYDTAFQYAEDYDLYCRCSSFMSLDNYPECLVQYRIHSESVSQKYKQQQVIDAKAALYLHLRRLRLPFSLDDFKIHTQFAFPDADKKCAYAKKVFEWINYLYAWNEKNNIFSKNLFGKNCIQYRDFFMESGEAR